MRTIKLLAVIGLLAATPASAWAHGHRSHGWRAPARAVYVAPARRVWVPGYRVHRGPRPFWQVGVWATPPQSGWSWVAPQWAWQGGRSIWQEGYWAPSAGPYAQGY